MNLIDLTEEEILLEKNFFSIKRKLENHIEDVVDDAKNIRPGVISTVMKKFDKTVDEYQNILKNERIDIDKVEKTFKKLNKRLEFFKQRFVDITDKIKNSEFRKDLVQDLLDILDKAKVKIDRLIIDASNYIEGRIEDAKKFNDKEDDEKKHKKVPVGLAQDIKTRKRVISKIGH